MIHSRQLAAIMFTDIVGYTALMGSDEANALTLLRKSRAIQQLLIEKYSGIWLKEMGDGVLAQFSSAFDAVSCAIEIQNQARVELEFPIRIGIHLGDVTTENHDVFGDGVNIASRLQSIADPGGIYVSESIQSAVRGRPEITLEYLGDVHLKGVNDKIKTFYVKSKDLPVPSSGKRNKLTKKKFKRLPVLVLTVIVLAVVAVIFWFEYRSSLTENSDNKSIAVLAFTDLSPEMDQEYFSDGMSEEIQNLLAKIPGLKVINSTSAFSYKGKNATLEQIGEELNVTHILQGSVRKAGNQFRIKTELIKVADGLNIWSEIYERDINEVFKIQDEIAEAIIKELKIVLGENNRTRIKPRPTVNLEAYRLYLQGQYYINLSGFSNINKAISLLEEAILLDPNFAIAYAVLAKTYILNDVDLNPSQDWAVKAYVSFQQALALDTNLAEAYVARGMWYWTPRNNFAHENAILDFKKAIKLKPGLSSAYEGLSLVQIHIGLLNKAMETAKKGIELDPTNMWLRHFLGQVYYFQGNYDEALKMYESVSKEFVPFFRIALTAQTLNYQGKVEEAMQMVEKGLLEYPSEPQLNSTYAIFLAKSGRNDEARKRMDLAIENQKKLRHVHHLYHNLASASVLLGQKKEALKWLIMAAENGLPCFPIFNQDPNLAGLKGDPDFKVFMIEMKKKLEYFNAL